MQTQSTQDNNCGENFVFKSVLNSKPFTDTLQQEFELHSTTINNQSVAPMDIQGFNAQLKEIDLESEKYDNCEAKKFISRKHRTRANKLDARHDNPSEACDCQTMARAPNSSLDMLRVLQTWTWKTRATTNNQTPVLEYLSGRKREATESGFSPDFPSKCRQTIQGGSDEQL